MMGITQEMFTKEMQAALKADAEKLKQLTGEDHSPIFLDDCDPKQCDGCGEMKADVRTVFVPHVGETSQCDACRGLSR